MNVMLAGLIGALFAAIFSISYGYVMFQTQRRSDLSLDVVSWIDDIYDRLLTIHAQREATFTNQKFGMSNDEYRIVVKEARSMLLASKMHAKVALVYGSQSQQIQMFDKMREEFISVAETLLQVEKEGWEESNKQINNRLSSVIDPLKDSTERSFILGTTSGAITRDILKDHIAPLYIPLRNAEDKALADMSKLHTGTATYLPRPADKGKGPVSMAVIILAALLAMILGIAIVRITPGLFKSIRTGHRAGVTESASPKVALCTSTPATYGLADIGGEALIADGGILTINKLEGPIRVGIKNQEERNLENAVFMIFLPYNIVTVNEHLWKAGLQELPSKSGRWYIASSRADIQPGEKAEFDPPIEVRFFKAGDHAIPYKFFCDNFPPKSGYFVIRAFEQAPQ